VKYHVVLPVHLNTTCFYLDTSYEFVDVSTYPLAAFRIEGRLTLFYCNKTGGRPSNRGDSSCQSDPFVLKMADASP